MIKLWPHYLSARLPSSVAENFLVRPPTYKNAASDLHAQTSRRELECFVAAIPFAIDVDGGGILSDAGSGDLGSCGNAEIIPNCSTLVPAYAAA